MAKTVIMRCWCAKGLRKTRQSVRRLTRRQKERRSEYRVLKYTARRGVRKREIPLKLQRKKSKSLLSAYYLCTFCNKKTLHRESLRR